VIDPQSAICNPQLEEFRAAGHRLVERMAEYLEKVAERPVSTPLDPTAIAARFAEPLPREGRPAAEVWDETWELVVGDAIHLAHPMYMGHQVAPPLPQAALGDALASLLNQSIAVWEMSPTGTFVEGQVIRWLVQLLGYPATADGTLVSGGSAANLTGLLAAREARFPGSWARGVGEAASGTAVLVSPQAHYSIGRAAGVMGLGADAIVVAPEHNGKIDPAGLDALLARLSGEGRTPLAVVATAGSTATGQFDPLDAIAEIAARHRVWLHVDAAHGASFLLSSRLRQRLRGIERADSVAWDPHKMMFMPISLGAVIVRDHAHLDAAFQQQAPYLFHARAGEARPLDTATRTLQCSRRFDALKLWLCLRHHGANHFAALADRTVEMTALLHQKLSEAEDFEPLHAPESNILCFRYLPPAAAQSPASLERLQAELRQCYNASGMGWITTTELHGRRVLRVTIINPATSEEHLDRLLGGLRAVGREVRREK
jgi:L-2,4-diaminobutyrate decarboxylase